MFGDSPLGDEVSELKKKKKGLKFRIEVIFRWREGAVFGIGQLEELRGGYCFSSLQGGFKGIIYIIH